VAALITLSIEGVCENARLVYLNVGDGPVDAVEAVEMLKGYKLDAKTINSAANHASKKEMDPIGNMHASADYQRHLSRVLTVRALEKAHNRAKSRLEIQS